MPLRVGAMVQDSGSVPRHSRASSADRAKPSTSPEGSNASTEAPASGGRSAGAASSSPKKSPKAERTSGKPGRSGSSAEPAAVDRGSDRSRSRSRSVSSEAASSDSSPPPRRAARGPQKRLPPITFQYKRTKGEVLRCKKGKRTDIEPTEWDTWGYAACDEVLRRPIVYDEQTVPIPRVKAEDITPEWFFENVSSKHKPMIIEGLCKNWPAIELWSIDALEERFRHVAFKVAKDDKGKKLRMKFKYYADYIRSQQDDSPLYLFETNMDDDGYIRPLIRDYEVPPIFPDDWFNLVNHDSRPPYRWFCIGPKRSGTTVHIDPLGTAAWNAVSHGVKHWVLFEPKESKKVVKGKDVIRKGEDDEAIHYFDFILPRIKKAHPDLRVYEGLQNPGDVIFVPGDWWHGVLNREDCVAATQNYCGADNFDLVWTRTRKEREKVAWLWLRNMKKYAPSLYERALELNKKDNFRMRHERPAGERLSDASSSSSESSSDSETDSPADLDPTGLQAALKPGTVLGADAFKHQGVGSERRMMCSSAKATPLPGSWTSATMPRKKRRLGSCGAPGKD